MNEILTMESPEAREEAEESTAEPEATDAFVLRRPPRVRLTAEETRARVKAFKTERKEALLAALRKDKN